MKSLVVTQFGAPDSLKVEEWAAPTPGADEVLIDVRAAGINFPDLLMISGKYYSHRVPPLPFIPGQECAGVVKAVGANVKLVKPGDRVMVWIHHGAFTQQVVVQELQCHVIPAAMGFPEAAALGVTYLTAYFALAERAALKPGEIVLVTGAAGGVGLAAVQIAKALGATVLAAVSSPEKAAAARANGADHIIDTSVADLHNALRAQVYAAVGEHGADVILDNVGGDVFDACLRAIAWGGRMLAVGFTSGRIPEIKAGVILIKNISVIGLAVGDYSDRQPERFRAVTQQLLAMCSAGKLKPQVMATFPLERYAEALALVKDRKVIGKVVLTTA